MATEEGDLVKGVGRALGALHIVSECVMGVVLEYERQPLSGAQGTAIGLLDRAACWLRTLHALGQTAHYQAYLAALRSMLELAVDLALLEHDPSLNDKIEAWEESAKYKAAKALLAYADRGNSVHMSLTEPRAFVASRAGTIDALRAKHWSPPPRQSPKHPRTGRWTGDTFINDVIAADKLSPHYKFEQTHAELYAYSCWAVHGSGLAATRNSDDPTLLVSAIGMSVAALADLAMVSTELTLRILDRLDTGREQVLGDTYKRWLEESGI